MRLSVTLIAACLAALALSTPAGSAATGPMLTAAPNPVHFGQTLTITGRHWPVIEFCQRTVRLRLTSAQNAFGIGTVRVKRNGRFSFRYAVRRSKVGAGRWKVRAKMNCESGENGSPNPIRRSVRITIK